MQTIISYSRTSIMFGKAQGLSIGKYRVTYTGTYVCVLTRLKSVFKLEGLFIVEETVKGVR